MSIPRLFMGRCIDCNKELFSPVDNYRSLMMVKSLGGAIYVFSKKIWPFTEIENTNAIRRRNVFFIVFGFKFLR